MSQFRKARAPVLQNRSVPIQCLSHASSVPGTSQRLGIGVRLLCSKDQHTFEAQHLTRKTFFYRSLDVQCLQTLHITSFSIGNMMISNRELKDKVRLGTMQPERPIEKSFASLRLGFESVLVIATKYPHIDSQTLGRSRDRAWIHQTPYWYGPVL